MSQLPTHTKKGSILTELILELFSLYGLLMSAGDRISGQVGLTSSLWKVLGALEQNPRTASQIARVMGLTRQSVQRSINILKKDGLVEAVINPDHRTSPLFEMTTKGQAVYQKVTQLQINWSNELAEDFQTEELKTAVSVLHTFINALEDSD